MLRKLELVICLLICVSVNTVLGQDIHFTQFYAQPLFINPALAGDYEGTFRLTAINRRQWGQLGVPIQTSGAGMEYKIWLNGDYLNIGAIFLDDKTTQVGFQTNKAYLSVSLQKAIATHELSLGIQTGFSRTALDPDQTFPSQFNTNTGSFDSGLDNNEPIDALNRSYLDINIGLFWKTIYNSRYRFKTGVSLAHLNRPNESLTNEISRVPFRYLVHHSTEILLNPVYTLISQTQLMYTGQAKEFITQLNLKKEVGQFTSVTAGLGYRGYIVENDAIIGLIEISYNNMDFGFSYDWNVSDLSSATQKTSVEFSLGLILPPPKRQKPVLYKKGKPCPIYVNPTN